MSWINPPESIRRFTVSQRIQHGAAILLWVLLVLASVGAILTGRSGWAAVHRNVGMACVLLLLYHLASVVAIGIRANVTADKIAFWPTGPEWAALRGAKIPAVGKYSPEEKTDYLVCLVLSTVLVLTGVFLLWPGRLGIPAGAAYSWLRTVHEGSGAALVLHLLLVHVPGRWIDAPGSFRMAVFTGKVPLEDAVVRGGWVSDLIAGGGLVPLPREETERRDVEESRQVREYLEEGNRLVLKGELEEACSAYENALRLYPGYSQALYNLGVARLKQGRTELAREKLRLFVDADPFNPMAVRARDILAGLPEGRKEDAP